jgi:ribose 5-phosphate isomerase B
VVSFPIKIAIASDHAGFALKEHLKKILKRLSHEAIDCGTDSTESVDYPDYAARAARALSDGECERAVLVCGSGIGMSIAANRFPRVRAALCRSVEDAEVSRRHNDSNALALGERFTQAGEAEKILHAWLSTPFEGGRHGRRVEKMEREKHG